MESSVPTPMTARVYVNLPEGISPIYDHGDLFAFFFPMIFPAFFMGVYCKCSPSPSQAAQSLRAAATAAAFGGAPGAAIVAAGFQGTDQQLPLGSIGTLGPGDLALICI